METTIDATEQSEHPAPSADAFKQLFDLLGLVKDASACELRLAELRRKHAAIRSAEKKLADDRAAHNAQLANDRAQLEAERAALQKRRLDVEAREAQVAERHRHIASLEDAWRNLGEPDAVKSGFQSPEFTPLQKARRAFTGRAISSERFGETTLTRSESGPEAA
jgi:hypothetical protein